jgi:hypothetical protein
MNGVLDGARASCPQTVRNTQSLFALRAHAGKMPALRSVTPYDYVLIRLK